jgi:hypothetical protein
LRVAYSDHKYSDAANLHCIGYLHKAYFAGGVLTVGKNNQRTYLAIVTSADHR